MEVLIIIVLVLFIGYCNYSFRKETIADGIEKAQKRENEKKKKEDEELKQRLRDEDKYDGNYHKRHSKISHPFHNFAISSNLSFVLIDSSFSSCG